MAVGGRVVVVLVHLEGAGPEDEVARPGVADHALGPAGVVPRLRPYAAGGGRVADPKVLIAPGRLDQRGVRLLVVPEVRVAVPLALLLGQQTGLDVLPRGGVGGV